MAAATLSANRDCKFQVGNLVQCKLAASKMIYKGALVGAASGLIQPFGDGSAEPFMGVAYDKSVSGASDTVYGKVYKSGIFTLAWYDDNAAAVGDIGSEVYAVSDSQVSPNASGSGATNKAANNIKCGVVVGLDGTSVRVRIDGYTK